MVHKVRSIFLYIIFSIVISASIYHHLVRHTTPDDQLFRLSPFPLALSDINQLVHEQNLYVDHTSTNPNTTSSIIIPNTTFSISTIAILLPAWQVLVVVSPENPPLRLNSSDFFCLFPNDDTSPAYPSGILPSLGRETFTCELPTRVRRRLPFPQPLLIKSPVDKNNYPQRSTPARELLRWDFLVYDVLFGENDVVVFVKGVNKRQGKNRDPQEFNCVFGDDVANGVRTAVTSSLQEVFRCQRPNLTAATSRIKVSLEFSADKRVIPSIAYGNPMRKLASSEPKSLLCACTMVYNVGKFLKEWVIYHSKIGVDKFMLYDNGSDDDLYKVVEELVKDGYNVTTQFWLWPKTQEAGFSHCAISAKDQCAWMMYADVDEFVYSDSWSSSSSPSKSMLQSLLPNSSYDSAQTLDLNPKVGEIMLGCHEFGPSDQKIHPVMGVMQGYNCRKKLENRHKSIVLLEAISDSLLNVVHHFILKEGYELKKMRTQNVVVNHYKFQAWPEFKAKFRRRVSAYVVDWTQTVNPGSNDRTPGLGFSAVEPEGWPEMFCEVHDNRLKELSERWFRVESPSGLKMAWQR